MLNRFAILGILVAVLLAFFPSDGWAPGAEEPYGSPYNLEGTPFEGDIVGTFCQDTYSDSYVCVGKDEIGGEIFGETLTKVGNASATLTFSGEWPVGDLETFQSLEAKDLVMEWGQGTIDSVTDNYMVYSAKNLQFINGTQFTAYIRVKRIVDIPGNATGQ